MNGDMEELMAYAALEDAGEMNYARLRALSRQA